jgi:putative flippase GtrA
MLTTEKSDKQLSRLVLQFWRYVLMSGASAIVTLGVPLLLHEVFAVDEEIAVLVALVIAFVVNFLTLRLYVFASESGATGQLAKFTLTSAGFRLGEYLFFLLGHNVLEFHYMYTLIATLVISVALKFVVYRFFVFADKSAAA